MDEKILIRSEKHITAKKLLQALSWVSALLFLWMLWDWSWGFKGNFGEAFAASSPFLAIMLICIIIYFRIVNCELVITDKRVYGEATFGKRVDLPLDSISAVGTSALWGIDVGTSSGRIHFKLIKNKDEIHSVMSKLLMERQQKETKNTVVENIISTSNADELKKFKDLLDSGVITQEEFDEKKKQLLGL